MLSYFWTFAVVDIFKLVKPRETKIWKIFVHKNSDNEVHVVVPEINFGKYRAFKWNWYFGNKTLGCQFPEKTSPQELASLKLNFCKNICEVNGFAAHEIVFKINRVFS